MRFDPVASLFLVWLLLLSLFVIVIERNDFLVVKGVGEHALVEHLFDVDRWLFLRILESLAGLHDDGVEELLVDPGIARALRNELLAPVALPYALVGHILGPFSSDTLNFFWIVLRLLDAKEVCAVLLPERDFASLRVVLDAADQFLQLQVRDDGDVAETDVACRENVPDKLGLLLSVGGQISVFLIDWDAADQRNVSAPE